jgi:hypothetical protein
MLLPRRPLAASASKLDASCVYHDRALTVSSRAALKKYVRANNKISSDAMFDSLFNRALRAGVEKGVFAQPKGMCHFPLHARNASNA